MQYASLASFSFKYTNNIWWGVQIMKLLIMQSPPLPCHHLPLSSGYFLKIVSFFITKVNFYLLLVAWSLKKYEMLCAYCIILILAVHRKLKGNT
jgi:hypothetical protein